MNKSAIEEVVTKILIKEYTIKRERNLIIY